MLNCKTTQQITFQFIVLSFSATKLHRLKKTFSNSLIIHIVISLPERPILVRWMSLETQ